MGLGAGFKLIDKDKDSIKETERDRDHLKETVDIANRWNVPEDNSEVVGHHPSGWTSMVEDWLCHAGGSHACKSSPLSHPDGGSSPSISDSVKKEQRRGPYQLLIKERMMGIYLAVYINRDIRELIEGKQTL